MAPLKDLNAIRQADAHPTDLSGQQLRNVYGTQSPTGIVPGCCSIVGRTVDVHCLRHTFATLLARNGVSPSVAQRLMRHSDIRLTMNTYTHLDLADTAGAVAALPAI